MEAIQIIYIYPYMLYLFENPRTRTLQWWPLQLILVTSKPNQTTHIYPYILYLFENPTPRTMLWRPLQLIWVTSAADFGDHQPNQIMHIYPYMICLAWFGGNIISCKGQNCNGHRCIVLFVGFSKGMSCRGEYALFGLVWFGAPTKKLQRSPSQCPWSGVFK